MVQVGKTLPLLWLRPISISGEATLCTVTALEYAPDLLDGPPVLLGGATCIAEPYALYASYKGFVSGRMILYNSNTSLLKPSLPPPVNAFKPL